jgi:hypothetical protein
MNLGAETTKKLTDSVEKIRERVLDGDSPCNKLAALEKQFAAFVPKKLSAEQRDELVAALDSIGSEVPCS